MAYLLISDFKNGMDRRRPRVAGVPGSLWRCENAVISRGGDIEKSKKFAPLYALPAGTKHMLAIGNRLYVFTSDAAVVADPNMPSEIEPQLLAHPSGAADLEAVVQALSAGDKPYVIARFTDGNVYHYYDGVRVAEWDGIADLNADLKGFVIYLRDLIATDPSVKVFATGEELIFEAATAGAPFTLTATATNTPFVIPQVDSVATATFPEGPASSALVSATIRVLSGTVTPADTNVDNQVTQVIADGVNLLENPVDMLSTFPATADALRDEINLDFGAHGYTATTDGDKVVLQAPVGVVDGDALVVDTSGDFITTNSDFVDSIRQIDDITVDGVSLIGAAVPAPSSPSLFAADVRNAINALTGTHGYSATRDGAVLSVVGPAAQSEATNGLFLEYESTGGIVLDLTSFEGGQDASSDVDDQAVLVSEIRANVVAAPSVDAQATFTITDAPYNIVDNSALTALAVDGTPLIAQPIFALPSLSDFTARIATEINNRTSEHGYFASASGATITLRAPIGDDAAANSRAISFAGVQGFQAVATDFAGGINEVLPVVQKAKISFGGTFEPQDVYSIILNGVDTKATGRASATGAFAMVLKNRMYFVAQTVVYYTAINDFFKLEPDLPSSGAGFFNVSLDDSGAGRLFSLAKYNDRVAVFADATIATYFLESDATQNQFVQSVENTGTVAAQSVRTYGNSDVFYLDQTGVRSLRARDSSNSAFASDIGTLIDTYIAALRKNAPSSVVQSAQSVVEPLDGRYWLALTDEILTLSNFPSSKIAAWSTQTPGFSIDAFARIGGDVFARSGDTVYLYGGISGEEYPDVAQAPTVIETPFLSADNPAAHKVLEGFDTAASGTWKYELLTNPNDETEVFEIARFKDTSMHVGDIKFPANTTMFAVRATCISEGAASLSMMGVHYQGDKTS